VVNPNGTILTANGVENPDLYWALRGGSGINFGIVTSILYQAQMLPPVMIGGRFHWPLDFSVVSMVAGLYYDIVWGVNSTGSDPFGFSLAWVPNSMGQIEMQLAGLWYDSDIELGYSFLQPFMSLPSTTYDISTGTFPVLMQPLMSIYENFGHLNWTMPDAMIAIPESRDSFIQFINTIVQQISLMPANCFVTWVFAPLGGKVNTFPTNHTAFPHRDSGGNLHLPTIWTDPSAEQIVRKFGQNSLAAISPWWTPSKTQPGFGEPMSYVNHPSEYLTNYQTCYWDSNYPTLQRVKMMYDPENFFSNGQGIMPQ